MFAAALSTSNTLPSAPTVPFGVACAFGSRLKLSTKRAVHGRLCSSCWPNSGRSVDSAGDQSPLVMILSLSILFLSVL